MALIDEQKLIFASGRQAFHGTQPANGPYYTRILWHPTRNDWVVGINDGYLGTLADKDSQIIEAPGSRLPGATNAINCWGICYDPSTDGIIYFARTTAWTLDANIDNASQAGAQFVTSSPGIFITPVGRQGLLGGGTLFYSDDNWATRGSTVIHAAAGSCQTCAVSKYGEYACFGGINVNSFIYWVDLTTDVTNPANWEVEGGDFSVAYSSAIGISDDGARVVCILVNGDAYIWDIGSAPYHIPAVDNPGWSGDNAGGVSQRAGQCVYYSQSHQGFFCFWSAVWVFIPDGTHELYRMRQFQPIYTRMPGGGVGAGMNTAQEDDSGNVILANGLDGTAASKNRITVFAQ